MAHKYYLTFITLFLLFSSQLFAQKITVSGKVTSAEDGEPLPGVNILEKGTQNGTATDIDGAFKVEVSNQNAVLQFSYVGFKNKDIIVSDQSFIEVELKLEVNTHYEVVVIGYGYSTKDKFTGAISKIDGEELNTLQVSSFEQGLQGRAAGVEVVRSSSAPNGGISMRIRGGNSILGGNEPLYVVDGFPIYSDNASSSAPNAGRPSQAVNALASINPNDIESVEVLKDASAAAIYGSRGANGVVLITTKKGIHGQPKVSYSGYYAVQSPAKKLDLINAQEFAQLANEASVNDGQSPDFVSDDPNDIFAKPELQGAGTDWQEELFRTTPMTNHHLSVSGGNEKARYYISGNYFNQQGILLGSDYWRGSFRSNVETDVSSKVTLGLNMMYSYSQSHLPQSESQGGNSSGVMNGVVAMPPVVPIFNPDGSYTLQNPVPNGTTTNNPLATARLTQDELLTQRMLATVFAKWNITEGLTFKTSFGTDQLGNERAIFHSKQTLLGSASNGRAAQSSRNLSSWLNENILTYRKFFGKHELEVLTAFTLQEQTNTGRLVESFDFANEQNGADFLQGGANPQIPQTSKAKWSLASWVGRLNYIFDDRYLFTLTGRADGSSKFGANNKWAFFPSAAFGWKISNEEFLEYSEVVDLLKWRISYGYTGNQEIAPYLSQANIIPANYPFNDALQTGTRIGRIPNPDLRWETTAMFNTGFDVELLGGKIDLTLDYYQNKTTDMLLEVTIPSSSGFKTAVQNSGSLENKGFEFTANYRLYEYEGFRMNIGGNFSLNRNKVLDLGESGAFYADNYTLYLNTTGSWVSPGQPIGVWRELEYDGVFRNQAELDAGPTRDGDVVGNMRFKDHSGDGKIDADDRAVIGDPNPNFIYGLSGEFGYKNFSLSLLFNGVEGADIRNVNRMQIATVGSYASQQREVLGRWTAENPNTDIPRASVLNNGAELQSSWQVEDGSYLRLSNVTLAYDFSSQVLKNVASSLQVYLSLQNPLLFTNYSGYDPEVNSAGQSNLLRGYDFNPYPRAKSIALGVNARF
ncbi:TonB-dependent receptor [Flammeovirgaceae bacterium SG7u.111]|nr:TonB-dependent receptor [Flammeovirgaceae bacterium SG7u.132]WPO36706.1 TonB-dependent receptor [Flammeovirgaceae bacterium SG7u.111]